MSSESTEPAQPARIRGRVSMLRRVVTARQLQHSSSTPPRQCVQSPVLACLSTSSSAASTVSSGSSQSWRARKRTVQNTEEVELLNEKFARLKSPTKCDSGSQHKHAEHDCSLPLRQAQMDIDQLQQPLQLTVAQPDHFGVSTDSTRSCTSLLVTSATKTKRSLTTCLAPDDFRTSALVPSHPSALVPLSTAALVVTGEAGVLLANQNKRLSRAEYKRIHEQQRNAQNYWRCSYTFPGQEGLQGDARNVYCRESLIRTKLHVLWHVGVPMAWRLPLCLGNHRHFRGKEAP